MAGEIYLDGIGFVHAPDQGSDDFIGVRAVAKLGYRTAPGGWQDIGEIHTAGLWGIEIEGVEGDTPTAEYVASVERDEFDELVILLGHLGFSEAQCKGARNQTHLGLSRFVCDRRIVETAPATA